MTNPPGDGETPREPSSPQPPPGPGPAVPPSAQPPGWGAPPPGQPAQGHPTGYPQPGSPWYPGPAAWQLPDHPGATKALVLGIVALLGGFACYLPLLIGPWAWAVGRSVVKEIDSQPGRYNGRGQALAGYVMGIVATVFLALAVLAVLGIITLFLLTASTDVGQPVPGESL